MTKIDFKNKATLGLQVIDAVLGHEGGYVNDENDRGGETIWGITSQTARENGYTGAMRSMSRNQAITIYEKQYWMKSGIIKIADLGANRLAYAVMDLGVNSGPARGIMFLQRAMNFLNLQGKRWPDLVDDGGFGAKSQAAFAAAMKLAPDMEDLLIELISAQRLVFLMNLAEKDQRQETFALGWTRRVNQVEATAEGR